MLIVRMIADNLSVADDQDAGRIALAFQPVFLEHGATGSMSLGDDGVWEMTVEAGDRAIEALVGQSLRQVADEHFAPSDLLITNHPPIIPKVFVSDMDSTMIAAECIDELADFAGIKPQIAAITERAMRGELDFAAALTERVGLLAGLPASAIDECLATRIAPMPGARVLVETLKAHGCRTVLVTGGFHQFADPVAADLGFEAAVANRLAIAEGKLTGGLEGAIVDSASKEAALRAGVAAAGQGAASLATGDGANDIPMLQAASYGIAFRAKPKARAAADGWIDRGDLTSVLRLLGIPRDRWVWE